MPETIQGPMLTTGVRCPYCDAEPGKWCRNKADTGDVLELHADRHIAQKFYNIGYRAAVHQMEHAIQEMARGR